MKKLFKKALIYVFVVAIIVQSLSPIAYLQLSSKAYAQEVTPTDTSTTIDQSTSPTDTSTPTPAVDEITPTDEISPTPTDVPTEEVTPAPAEEVTPTETLPVDNLSPPADGFLISSEPSATLTTPSEWTFENVELNKEYVAPQNSGVKLTFTKLPDPSGNIKIEEITLTEDQINQTGSLSDKAYDITSDMMDGSFSYNLSLPIPESSKGKAVEVKFAEELSNIGTAEKVENTLTKTDTSVSVTSLNHFTIFVVTHTEVNCPGGVYAAGVCYATIQEAINAAVSGDTINVAAGTYDEQLVIDGKSLTLQGVGDTTIIRPSAPATLTSTYSYPAGMYAPWTGTVMGSIILVKNSANVTIKDLKVDGVNVTSVPAGASRVAGILYGESGGTIDNATVTTMVVDGYVTRSYGIDLSAVGTARNVEVMNSDITNWSRNGIQAQGASLTANIHNNTLVGPGNTLVAAAVPNGILFIHGVNGNATNNTISAMHTTASVSRSAGILFFDPVTAGIVVENNNIFDVDDGVLVGHNANDVIIRLNNLHNNTKGIQLEDGATNNSITGNTITNNTYGIFLDTDTDAGTGNTASNNSITGSVTAGVNNLSANAFSATCNWWGNADGPSNEGPGSGDAVSENVDFTPWLTSDDLNSDTNCDGSPAVLTIVKQTDPSDSGENFNFTFNNDDSEFILSDGESETFDGLIPGSYGINEIAQEGWQLANITCDEGTTWFNDPGESDIEVVLGTGDDITCTYTNTTRSIVSGMKWNDVNSDRQPLGESGIAGWTINLFVSSFDEDTDTLVIEPTPTSTTTTDADGNYSFNNLDPELNYVVCEVLQSGWEQTSPIIVSDGTVICANGTVGHRIQGGGEPDTITNINFGNHNTPAPLSGGGGGGAGDGLSDGLGCANNDCSNQPSNSQEGPVLGAFTGPTAGLAFTPDTEQEVLGVGTQEEVLGTESASPTLIPTSAEEQNPTVNSADSFFGNYIIPLLIFLFIVGLLYFLYRKRKRNNNS